VGLGSEKQYFDFNKPTDQKNLARLLANWSPSFITEWFEGKTIQQWYQDNDISQEKQQEWNKIFTPAMMKYLIVGNLTDPIGALNTIKYNLETVLTDQNLADQFNLSIDEAQALLPPSLRKYVAIHHIMDPLASCQRYYQT
jgi:hypothetical protein